MLSAVRYNFDTGWNVTFENGGHCDVETTTRSYLAEGTRMGLYGEELEGGHLY